MGEDDPRAGVDISLALLVEIYRTFLTEMSVANKYLVIDAATQNVQCGFSDIEHGLENVACAYGDVLESLSFLVGELMRGCTFQDLEGIIYCYGPGSTLGLRSCVTMVNIWQKLCPKCLHLFRYSSLDMAANIINFESTVVASVGNKKYVVREAGSVSGEYMFVDQVPPEAKFLQTRRLKDSCPNNPVEYKIDRYQGTLATILKEVGQPELFDCGERNFVKWDCRRHSADKI